MRVANHAQGVLRDVVLTFAVGFVVGVVLAVVYLLV